jgi:hypothetical protein
VIWIWSDWSNRAGLRELGENGDRAPNANPVIVLSHASWQHEFHGDPQVVRRLVKINGTAYTIIGVAPKTFTGNLFASAGTGFLRPRLDARAVSSRTGLVAAANRF